MHPLSHDILRSKGEKVKKCYNDSTNTKTAFSSQKNSGDERRLQALR